MFAKFLPHGLYTDWLDADLAEALLSYAEDNQNHFKPSELLNKDRQAVVSERRVSLRLRNLGAFADPLRRQALDMTPKLIVSLGLSPFTPDFVELELVAHGDGAVFMPHSDTVTGAAKQKTPRQISMVAYFFRRPRRFTGGQLRYFALDGKTHVDIEPVHNLLLAFPSIAPHSVRSVSCPGIAFRDWRFAVNMWVHG